MPEPKRYRLLTGQFFVRFDEREQKDQPQPDGDTVRFVPDNPLPFFDPSKIRRYGFVGPDLTNFGINVRFEGVDALETHYPPSNAHQHLGLGKATRDLALHDLGFTGVVFDDTFRYTVKSVKENPRRGYVIANGVEGNSRLLGLVYPGEPNGIPEYEQWKNGPSASGLASRPRLHPAIPVFVDIGLLEKSVNWKLIDAGLVYAELYTSMPLDLLRHLARRVRELRREPPAESIWSRETVAIGKRFVWDKQINSLSDSVMFPKLFRRLVTYSLGASKPGNRPFFMAWLRDKSFVRERDDRLLLPPQPGSVDPPNCEFGNLHDLIQVHGKETDTSVEISLTENPEDVIVLPDNV
jgi:hypothetical protein